MVKGLLLLLLALAGSAAADAPDFRLEGEVEPARVAVQTQAVYTLRFFQGADVRDLKIQPPALPLADFRPLGETRIYETRRDGRRYRVHERRYALFPFASGSLALAGARAEGRVAAAGEKSADGRRLARFEAPAAVLTVVPVPARAALGARDVRLAETWEKPPGEIAVGTVLHRRIRLEALGVDAGQLPDLAFTVPGMAVHGAGSTLENRFQGDLNLASREQVFKLVALQPGPVAVPELGLDWWQADKEEMVRAVLPARRIVVAGAPAPASAVPDPVPEPFPWQPSVLVLCGLGTGFLAWGRRRTLAATWRLERACRAGDARAVARGLLERAARRFPDSPPATLGALADTLKDAEGQGAALALERQLYGPGDGHWNRAELAAAVRRVSRALREA